MPEAKSSNKTSLPILPFSAKYLSQALKFVVCRKPRQKHIAKWLNHLGASLVRTCHIAHQIRSLQIAFAVLNNSHLWTSEIRGSFHMITVIVSFLSLCTQPLQTSGSCHPCGEAGHCRSTPVQLAHSCPICNPRNIFVSKIFKSFGDWKGSWYRNGDLWGVTGNRHWSVDFNPSFLLQPTLSSYQRREVGQDGIPKPITLGYRDHTGSSKRWRENT